ncbi:hypothetical protein EZV62_028198 [Acer yangbiense]|uniref:DUF7903 domain-containing protein n=1 Tax=Acer yangbiense TaxID=1000413 RepID=A0A5C7GP92_9ROSI|nr:hypothetical protein EZV62_028198 [Acer yangbiense]
MAYIPPHKRRSKDSERPSPIPERLVPRFSRQVNLKSSFNANHNLNRIAISRQYMYIIGLDADNQFPSFVHLVPTSVESFRHRLTEMPLVLVNSYPATKEIDEEGEAISSTPSETISSTPWKSVAVDVWPNLLSAFEIVRNMLESNDELDEVKPAMVAKFGKILFHPNPSVRSLIKYRVVETTLRQMNTTFYANAPSSYMENIISGVAPKIGFDLEEDKDMFHILLSDDTKPKNYEIYCKCRMKEDKKLELYKVETNPVREMTKNILCIDKNLDLRLALHTKRILTSLTDDEMHSIGNIINSAVIDPEVNGGLSWPYEKACSGDRFAVVEIWHTIAKKYKSPSLSLMARHVDRFNFEDAYSEDSTEVYLKLKRLVSDLQEEKVETDSILEMFKDNLKMIWDHFLDVETPISERLVLSENARKASSSRSMYIVGLDADNQFPSSVHLVPTFIESFKHRFVVKPLVLVSSYPATKDETISSTPSETISSTPWESVAVDVWPKLLSAFEIVRDKLESNDELDEVKPAIFARFGKILFHPNASVRSLIKTRVAETTLRQMKTTFYVNTPPSYMENIISGVAPKIGFDLEEDKDIFYILLSDSTKPSNSWIYCKCRMKEDKKLELYKVELNPVRKMIEDISCIDKNLDLRLALQTKRILTSLTDDEMHSIGNIINSAIIDPEVKGGLRWPYGKACSGDRFAVIKIWHSIAKKYKSPSLSLMARHVDRFDFEDTYGQDSIEVYVKLKSLVSDLQVNQSFPNKEDKRQEQKDGGGFSKDFMSRETGYKYSFVEAVRGLKINGGSKPFVVKMEEEATPMDMVWLESFLALRKTKGQGGRNSMPKKETFQICWPKEVSEAFSRFSSQVGKAMSCKGESYQVDICVDLGPLEVSIAKSGYPDRCLKTVMSHEEDYSNKEEGFSTDSVATKEEMVIATTTVERQGQLQTDGGTYENSEAENFSNDNSFSKK